MKECLGGTGYNLLISEGIENVESGQDNANAQDSMSEIDVESESFPRGPEESVDIEDRG